MGSAVKKVTKPIKKIVKSPLAPIAAGIFGPAALAAMGPGTFGAGAALGGIGTRAALSNIIAQAAQGEGIDPKSAALSGITASLGQAGKDYGGVSKGINAGASSSAVGSMDPGIATESIFKQAANSGLTQLPEAAMLNEAIIEKAASPTLLQKAAGTIGKTLVPDFTSNDSIPNIGSNLLKGSTALAVNPGTAVVAAELNQQALDEYNANLMNSGMNDRGARRQAIFQIYMNAGYDPDEVNATLDKYGYAEGGIASFRYGGRGAKTPSIQDYTIGMKEILKGKVPDEVIEVDSNTQIVQSVDNDGNRIISVRDTSDDLTENLANAKEGIEMAFGRSFNESEPQPMMNMRFAGGGDVGEYKDIPNIFNHSDDGGIMNKISESMERDYDYFTRIKMRENLKQGETMEDAADLSEQEAMDMVMNKYTQGGFAGGGKVIKMMPDKIIWKGKAKDYPGIKEIIRQNRKKKTGPGVKKRAEGGMMTADEYFKKKGKQKTLNNYEKMRQEYEEYKYKQKYGPRDSAAEGGIMNKDLLNTGMDKDMRGGGFIPEGTKEKADDVPARLSKNEFVMTADAVRAAGGGSVNQGAKRMYDAMHQLEAKV